MTAAVQAPTRQWEVVAGRRLHVALVAAASAVAVTSSGDAFLLAALLGLVAADAAVAGVGALVAVSMTITYGSSSLAAGAGAQAVLGPAITTGDVASVAAAWTGALALALLGRRGLPLLAFGMAAGTVAAGPDVHDAVGLAIRLAGAILGVVAAWAAARYVPRRSARWAAAAFAGAAVSLAAAGRFLA